MEYLLGIDVGTGGSRAVLTDQNGEIVASATCEHVPFASPKTGWAEQDPKDWHRATGSAVRQAISAAGIVATARFASSRLQVARLGRGSENFSGRARTNAMPAA